MGDSGERRMPRQENPGSYGRYGSEPFFPHHVLRQVIQFVLLFAILILLASFAPGPILPKADPFDTPEKIKPEWYFLAAYQFLKIAEKLSFLGQWAPIALGVLFQGLGAMAVWFLPFWDRNPERHPTQRPKAIRIGISVTFFLLILTIWGYFS
jgi:ubiquinol-cytochrome c reductase cytochrome b subunit